MALFKCKMCGGTLEVTGESVATCEYCGTQQTLPRLDDDRKANLYDRANHFRRNNEFDKAIGIYEQILTADTTDAESYWSLVLCRYGIEYVEDPTTHKRVPTVNRAQFTSIFDDDNYKSALQYADVYQRHLYEEEAKAINEIQKGILEISQKEEPFDVFICYKETDAHGRRTQDSVLATDLYHQLTNEGFKVFFSRITLEDKLGVAYEPYIFAALNSAKVMVVLGTRAEHFNAVWVKNEWSRYLALIRGGAKKTLIPAYRDMDPYDLPEEFSHLQAQDMSKLGFMQDLIRGIKKIAQSEEPKQTTAKETAASVGNSAAVQLLKRGNMALEDGDWERADEFFEQALNADAELADAYLGKFFAEQEASNAEEFVSSWLNEAKDVDAVKREVSSVNERIDALAAAYRVEHYLEAAEIKVRFAKFNNKYDSTVEAKQEHLHEAEDLFATDRLLLRAKQFGSSAVAQMKEQLIDGLQRLLDEARQQDTASVERIQQEFEPIYEEQERWAATEKTTRIEKVYSLAVASRAEKNFVRAGQLFESLGDYRDSVIQSEQCYELQKTKEVRKAKKTKRIVIFASSCVVAAIAAFFLITKVVVPANKYKNAVALMETEKYEEAISAFEALDGYKDSGEQIEICENIIHTAILEAKYNEAVELMDAGQYEEASSVFRELGDYKDSAEKNGIIRLKNLNASIKVGDYIKFGEYEQDNNTSNGKEDIEWLVLDVEDGKALVISKYVIEVMTYNTFEGAVTWEECTLRKWLNSEFLDLGFAEIEKNMIPTVSIPSDLNLPNLGLPMRDYDTQDKVFLLTSAEVSALFISDRAIDCTATKYALSHGVRTGNDNNKCFWWVRTINYTRATESEVRNSNLTGFFPFDVDARNGVRPAMWIQIPG